ncbi:MAG: DUF308 domain-containing protein [Anaerolineae bacterium]|nr:DUF308 domain-containing protein [Anaerolineae bacterium]
MTVATATKSPNNWWLLLLQGTALIILGMLLLTAPGLVVTSLIIFLGAYWLVDGMFAIIRIFLKTTDVHWGLLLVRGILGVLAGLAILRHPLIGAVLVPTVLVIVLGVQGLLMGVAGLIEAFKGGGWGAGLLAAVNIIFGLLLIFNPLLAAFGLPFVFGGLAIGGGLMAIVMAFQQR